jgi:phosphoribosylformylglycinamidine synthase subunit PurL
LIRIPIRGRSDEEIRSAAGQHGMRLPPLEWRDLAERLGRDPTLPEAFLFDVGLSEHCSYKSSRPLLKEYLPPLASHVVLGPGEDSGIVSLGEWQGPGQTAAEEWVLVVAHESHNHPSQVLPVEGAATGIGGIVRDVYCMGADVVGVLDGLRFGDPAGPNGARVRAIARGVIQGISEYGNALGVPNLGGDVFFHEGFDDNCLVNVVALGIMPRRRIIRSRVPEQARRDPYVLVLVGKPTDDTGLGGAAFASQILDDAEVGGNRGAVQIHDPFLKRVLAEATREALEWIEQESIPVGCKDLGAGGLGGASSELVMAGGFGAEIDLGRVPVGLPGLEPHQILCAETQERFVWAVPETRAESFCDFFNEAYELNRIYPGAAARVIGRVIPDLVYRCLWQGETAVEVPNEILETPPVLQRPRQSRPTPALASDPAPPANGSDGWVEWVGRQITSWNAASRAPVFRFYDQEVRGEAFVRPGEADAGIFRPIPGAALGLAVSLDGNPEYGALDPYWAGVAAVFESARNVAAVGARPLCLTDCLNFGNPEDPVCLGDFEEALRGMRDACRAIGSPARPDEPLPIVSGNVSFYNQSATGRAIPPAPMVCCYGMLPDYGRAVTSRLKGSGDALLVTGRRGRAWGRPGPGPGGRVPLQNLDEGAREIRLLGDLIDQGTIRAAHDISDGGLLRALWEMMVGEDEPSIWGIELDLAALRADGDLPLPDHELLLSESSGFVLEVAPEQMQFVLDRFACAGLTAARAGQVTAEPAFRITRGRGRLFEFKSAELHPIWRMRLHAITHRAEEDQP